MAFLNPLSNTFGLDIGDRSFKLVQLKKMRGGPKPYRLIAWNEVAVPEGILERGEIVNVEKAAEYVRKLMAGAKGKLSGKAVVACLPEPRTFIKIIQVDDVADVNALKKAVLNDIEQNIPLPKDEIYFDWQVADEPGAAAEAAAAPAETETDAPEPPAPAEEKKARRVMIGAAPKVLVDAYVAMLEQAGLAPIALEIEAMSLTRTLIADDDIDLEPVGILDIGATRSSLAIYDQGVLQMTISIPVSGNEITKAIAAALNLDFEDAELLKIECGLDAGRCEDKMWKILLPLVDDMTDKIHNALRFYKIGFPSGKKIEKLHLCGGGAGFRDIDNVLSRKLTIKVRRGNALVNLAPKFPAGFPQEDHLSYATAIGLAMRAVDEGEKRKSSFKIE
ncbi:pilus assembly protein PilM [Candidatus Uhrbacteria bacterium]|nr:pilus assembly protein PilM [Candidatus Uhrbacteria bacterium]